MKKASLLFVCLFIIAASIADIFQEPTPNPLNRYSTQNTRWLKQVHPAMYHRLEALDWVKDGLSELERDTIDQLLYLDQDGIANLEAVLSLAWVQDDITTTERDALDWIGSITLESESAANSIIGMPFLESLEPDDVLAIRGLDRLARRSDDGLLSALLDDPTLSTGITDAQTTLVAAAGTLRDADEVRRLLIPNNAYIKTESIGTELSPALRITIVRFETPGQPWTFSIIRDAVEFTETIMQRPLPVNHVILVMSEQAVLEDAAGVNFGFAISRLPRLEEGRRDYDKYRFSSTILHEIAHYFWRANADWIDEGVADTFPFMHGVEIGMSPGLLGTRSRKKCAAQDLQMLTREDPSKQDPQFPCNYFLGQSLFLDLLENQGVEDFNQGLRELYRLSLAEAETGGEAGIGAVRQAFPEHAGIVNKHWSGKLNAPENRIHDEGSVWSSHGLIQWDQYPTYDGLSVTFRGTLLGDATLSRETVERARSGGSQNFWLVRADEIGYEGSILPALPDDREWHLDDPGDAVATRYLLEGRTINVKFTFPRSLDSPSSYGIIVWGFKDDSRRPFLTTKVDPLGYARIRADE